jgi:nicotinate-nucleotide--dimethylbenzimidazole phosphoribosyltransferase
MQADLAALARITGDGESAEVVRARSVEVLRPRGALCRLDEIAVWLARWQRTDQPQVANPAVLIFAGDHGVAAEGVSAYPQSVTRAMIGALEAGIATASVMARRVGARLSVIDVGDGAPCGNIRLESALTTGQLDAAMTAGRTAVADVGDVDLLIPGEIGIGNTTAAAAIATSLLGGAASDWVGPGTGLDSAGMAQKVAVVSEAVDRAAITTPLDALAELGGWELAAMAGAILEARARSIPILLDGFVVTAAALPLELAEPGLLDHCWPAHVSAEPGHRRLVDRLGRRPILDLEMRLGEGSGALAAVPIVALAADAVVRVATFGEAGLA